jgi:3-hydroxyisobutyrate dehydrogenase
MTRVGFIGLGDQGGRMASRVIAAGFPTTLWARRAETLEPFVAAGAETAASPAELAAESDIVGICVVDDAGVEEVLGGENGVFAGLAPGGLVMVHSTVQPDTCRRLAVDAAALGLTLIDAPVSGGGAVAAEGKLLVMVGGETEAVERARPVLETFGDRIVHLGPVGSGQVAKVINNLIFAAHLGTANEVFATGRAMGLDLAAFASVLEHGSGRSYAMNVVAGMGHAVAPLGPFAGALLHKDVEIALQLANEANVDLDVLLTAADAALDAMGHSRAEQP